MDMEHQMSACPKNGPLWQGTWENACERRERAEPQALTIVRGIIPLVEGDVARERCHKPAMDERDLPRDLSHTLQCREVIHAESDPNP